MPINPHFEELEAAKYYSGLALQRPQLPTSLESHLQSAFKHASMFDIETGDLHSSTPIYESGVQHGVDNPQFFHAFARPTNIAGTSRGYVGGFTERSLQNRFGMPAQDVLDIFGKSPLGQRDIVAQTLDQLSGRDIWVQNLRHEREFINARLGSEKVQGPDAFLEWAKKNNLQTHSTGLYTTDIGIKRATVLANQGQYSKTPVEQYLSRWEGVFGEYKRALGGPRPQGTTRVFEMMDLTKSVFAMAQSRGFMPQTGELFAGTGIEALSRGMFGIGERHTSLGDAALQGELTRHLYAAGNLMSENQTLPEQYQKFFKNMGDIVPYAKQRGLVKNIVSTFRDIEKFKLSEELGRPDWDLLRGARTKPDPIPGKMTLNTQNPETGAYSEEVYHYVTRKAVHPSNKEYYTTDINELVSSWEEQAKGRHGVIPDYKAALEEARREYIAPYQARKTQLGGSTSGALLETESLFEELSQKIDKQITSRIGIPLEVKPSGFKTKLSSFAKENWPTALLVGGAMLAGGWLFSGRDDEYNTIEGLRHQGFAGETRSKVTDFGSGFDPLKQLAKQANMSFGDILNHPNLKRLLEEGKILKELGTGKFGKADLMETALGTVPFKYVRKTPHSIDYLLTNEDTIGKSPEFINNWAMLAQRDIKQEALALRRLSDSDLTPTPYLFAKNRLYMELMPGTRVADIYDAPGLKQKLKPKLEEMLNISRKYGVYNEDIHGGNILFDKSSGRMSWIDFGASYFFPRGVRQPEPEQEMVRSFNKILDYFTPTPVQSNQFSGFDDAYNTIEGLRHGGVAGANRNRITDFGSGWDPLRSLLRAEETLASIFRDKAVQQAFINAKELKILGKGEFGTSYLMETTVRGKPFQFVRKRGKIGEHEAEFATRAEDSVAPTVYGHSRRHIDMEYFPGELLGDVPADELAAMGVGKIEDAVRAIHKVGIFHNDLHFSNMMRVKTPQGKHEIGIIDFGYPYAAASGTPTKPLRVRRTPSENHLTFQDITLGQGFTEDMARVRESFDYYSDPVWRAAEAQKLQALAPTKKVPTRNMQLQAQLHMQHGQAPDRIQANIQGNTIPGFQEEAPITGKKGIMARLRHFFGFGSPWQGMSDEDKYNLSVYGVEGLNRKYGHPSSASIKIKDYFVEDADTIRLLMEGGKERTIRLAGIDAPEISHDEDYSTNRVNQDQPYGSQAATRLKDILAQQDSLRAIIDPTGGSTYGRDVGVLVGADGQNINLELVRQGAAASLPFGDISSRLVDTNEFRKAEEEASAQEEGMWGFQGWQNVRDLQEGMKRRITNTTFTDPKDLFNNFKAASMAARLNNPDDDLSDMQAAGGRDDFNILEGLRHGWASSNRKLNTDFGSGYKTSDVIETMKLSTKTHRILQKGQRRANSYMRNAVRNNKQMMIGHHIG